MAQQASSFKGRVTASSAKQSSGKQLGESKEATEALLAELRGGYRTEVKPGRHAEWAGFVELLAAEEKATGLQSPTKSPSHASVTNEPSRASQVSGVMAAEDASVNEDDPTRSHVPDEGGASGDDAGGISTVNLKVRRRSLMDAPELGLVDVPGGSARTSACEDTPSSRLDDDGIPMWLRLESDQGSSSEALSGLAGGSEADDPTSASLRTQWAELEAAERAYEAALCARLEAHTARALDVQRAENLAMDRELAELDERAERWYVAVTAQTQTYLEEQEVLDALVDRRASQQAGGKSTSLSPERRLAVLDDARAALGEIRSGRDVSRRDEWARERVELEEAMAAADERVAGGGRVGVFRKRDAADLSEAWSEFSRVAVEREHALEKASHVAMHMPMPRSRARTCTCTCPCTPSRKRATWPCPTPEPCSNARGLVRGLADAHAQIACAACTITPTHAAAAGHSYAEHSAAQLLPRERGGRWRGWAVVRHPPSCTKDGALPRTHTWWVWVFAGVVEGWMLMVLARVV